MSLTPKSISTTTDLKNSDDQASRRVNLLPFWLGLGAAFLLTQDIFMSHGRYINVLPSWAYDPPPLVMDGGDPYVRALMRTISASEANYARPYSILYGGKRFSDLSEHPNQCILITVGPNKGDCTTAAGRYQFLTNTWLEKAEKYHPERSLLWISNSYRFNPEFQDEVVYNWLMDSSAWGIDVSAELRQGDLDTVLRLLSGTWTSLGYGIETNTVSPMLPRIYESMLEDELAIANSR